jgi:hypothetical protein
MRNRLTVKGLPPGWKVLQLARGRDNPYDAFVLCERDPHDPRDHCQFVTWRANLELGGCVGGEYRETYDEALQSFNKRKAVLR